MGNDKESLEKSRSYLRSKRRKTNIILNALIAIVVLLIIVVSVNIFGDNGQKNSAEEVASTVDSDKEKTSEEKGRRDEDEPINREEDQNEEDIDSDQSEEDESIVEDESEEENDQDELIIQEGGKDPDVVRTITNPAWEPVGTTQGGSPAQDYNMSGVDWQEMVAAISVATGFDESQGDILYRLGNNGPKSSVATILKRDTNQKFRIYIQWIDEQGWKPELVEELIN